MAKLKHNDPCHCGSKKKYRSCHMQSDRKAATQAKATSAASASTSSAPQVAPGRPAWLRVVPVVVGILGVAGSLWVSMEVDATRGGGVLLVTGVLVVAMYVFGDPPPPRDDAGNPAAINFGR